MSSIRVSEKHGVNPSLEQCFVCGEAKGVVLFGRMKGDAEAPRQVCMDKEPCDKCKEHMTMGVILISVKEGTDMDNPYRTGGWCVVKEEVIPRMGASEEMTRDILKKRVCFIEDRAWDAMGLPRGKV